MDLCDCSQHTLHYEKPRAEMICCVERTKLFLFFVVKTGLCRSFPYILKPMFSI